MLQGDSMSQPIHKLFNRARLDDRQVNELLGLSHGIIADGKVSMEEAQYLQKWLEELIFWANETDSLGVMKEFFETKAMWYPR